MKRAARQIAVLAFALLAFCIACRLLTENRYIALIPIPASGEDAAGRERFEICVNDEEIVECTQQEVREGYVRVAFSANRKGSAYAELRNGSGDVLARYDLSVDRFLTIYNRSNGSFTADTAVVLSITLFFLLVSAVMLHAFLTARWPGFYSYSSVYYAGFSLFSLAVGLMMLTVTLRRLFSPAAYSMMDAYGTIEEACMHFMLLTLPFVAVFSALLILSNAVLLKKEGAGVSHMLGILVGTVLIGGEAALLILDPLSPQAPAQYLRVRGTVLNVCATLYAYFECMLAGSVICAVKAAAHVPSLDRDFILILGSRFRKDGTLPPLLKARADRAIDFWRKQKKESGRSACFIPCGGKGTDEPMSEAEAIGRYLKECGIPEDLIRMEKRSSNTYENMSNAKEIVASYGPAAKTAFATSDYHVFRSGVWAGMAGLEAEGIGSETRWWYWPNAFMREVAGLLAKSWKQEILLLIALNAFFFALAMVVG